VLNGEPFIRYNLRAIYPFAHQIIVVEGACAAAAAVARHDGHSADGTLESLMRFKAEEDPEQKLVIVSAAEEGYSDGFWPEKNEMCWAYARRATGNYLWQIDSDEFYHEADVPKILALLEEGVDAISFPTLHFWGGVDYIVNGFHMICDGYREYHRLFAWGPGYAYRNHRPPTVVDDQGRDVRSKQWVRATALERLGVWMYHYTYLFPHQVFSKASYYSGWSQGKLQQRGHIPKADRWAREVYIGLKRPYRMFIREQCISWVERHIGAQPSEVTRMMEDVRQGRVQVETRTQTDLQRLLSSRLYRLNSGFLRLSAGWLAGPAGWWLRRYSLALVRRLRNGALLCRMRPRPSA